MEGAIQTQQATLTRIGPNEVEVRFAGGMLIDRAGIAEIMQERKRMCGDTPVGLLVIVPNDSELDLAVINTDHYRVNQSGDRVLALALVAGTITAETLMRLYQAYYPPTFRAEVFLSETEARGWLRACIGDLADHKE